MFKISNLHIKMTLESALGVLLALISCFMVPPSVEAGEVLGSARLQVAGTQLTVSPASHTVPFDFPTVVDTSLVGYDPENGVLPTNMLVVGDFSGPEVDGVLRLETVPNEPFRIPRLRLEGEYRLENIRLVQEGEILAYAEPSTAVVHVAQILVTRVESRALTAEELASYGLSLDEDNYQVLNLTFGFAVNGEEFVYDMPVMYNAYGPNVSVYDDERILRLPMFDSTVRRTVIERFLAPRLEPFKLDLEKPEREITDPNGCDVNDPECRSDIDLARPIVGVMMFPTDLSLLHQFFSVILMAQNGAPAGDLAVLKDVVAQISLPSGLRLGETDPPALVGGPVQLMQAGPDGEPGTGDDIDLLAAGETGRAEFLVEGRKEGTHMVDFDISAVLEGLPTGPQALSGSARGAVAVRDPQLGVHIAHPESVRANVEYWLYTTFTNMGTAPINGLSIGFPSYAISGLTFVGSSDQTVGSLLPRESTTLKFRIRPTRTGRIVASSIKAGSSVLPSFEYSIEVGGDGAQSPDSLRLPRETAHLPEGMVQSALALVGMGYSLEQNPPTLESGLPRVTKETVSERVYRLKQSGLHVDIGANLFDVASSMALAWGGGRDQDWDWDELIRTTQAGGEWEAAVAAVLDAESSSALAAFDEFAATTHSLGPQAVLTVGGGLDLTVSSRTSGKRVAGSGLESDRIRELPFGQVYDLAGGRMTLLSSPEDGGYEVGLIHETGGAAEVHLLVPDTSGGLRMVRFTNLSLLAGATATVEFQSNQTLFDLHIDDDNDGVVDQIVAGQVETPAPRPFEVVAAKVDATRDPSSHLLEVLFSQDVDLASLYPSDASRFVIPGNTSNGGLIPTEENLISMRIAGAVEHENPFLGLSNPRLVQLVFDNPINALADQYLTVSDLTSVTGEPLVEQTLLITPSEDAQPGVALEGYFYGADGQVVAGAEVILRQWDLVGMVPDVFCSPHTTAVTKTDANGRFAFDYVRQTECGETVELKAKDPVSGFFGSATGRVARLGETMQLNIVSLRRGTIKGRVLYSDGTVPNDFEVIASNRDFNKGRQAYVDEDGYYNVGQVVVGTITLVAHDNLGNFVFRTIELPDGEAPIEQDLVIIARRLDESPPSRVRGVVTYDDGDPAFGAFIALYVDEQPVGTRWSDPDGRFDFGLVPSGVAEIEVYAEASLVGAAATRFFFETHPDQVSDLDLQLFNVVGVLEGYVYDKAWNGTVTAKSGAVVYIDGTPFNTVTDSSGYYRFDRVFAGNWTVRAAEVESKTSVIEQVTITSEAEASGEPVQQDLYFNQSLPDGGIVGRVLDQNGQPVAGADLRIAGGYYAVRWWTGTTTDSNGYYSFEGIGAGSYGIHALKDDIGTVAFAEVLYPGYTAHLDLQFRKGKVKIETVAHKEDGTEVPVISYVKYRCVRVVSEWSLVVVEPDFNVASTRPEDGILEIDCLMGPYEAYIHNPFHDEIQLQGYANSARGELIYDGDVQHHKIVYEDNGTIRGRVLDYDGETPVAGVHVNLTGGNITAFDVTTDEAGYFEFRLVPKGHYNLVALHDTGVVFRTARIKTRLSTFGGEIDVEIGLPEQGSVYGEVRDQNDAVVPGAVVTLWESVYPRRRLEQVADLDGRYAFHNVFVGEIVVNAQAPTLGGLAGRMTAELEFEGQELATQVTLEGSGEIIGTLIHPDTGLPAPNAEVFLYEQFSYRGMGWWPGSIRPLSRCSSTTPSCLCLSRMRISISRYGNWQHISELVPL